MKIHHIGYLVKNIDKALISFASLGFSPITELVYDESRDVNIRFIENNGYVIELISPVSEKSVVNDLYLKYKNSPYHICYIADNFDADILVLRKKGFTPTGKASPAVAINNKLVIFMIHPHSGMIELIEP